MDPVVMLPQHLPQQLPPPDWRVIDAWLAGHGYLCPSCPCLRLAAPPAAPDEFEPEPEWDSDDSNAYQDRVEAGLEPEWPDD